MKNSIYVVKQDDKYVAREIDLGVTFNFCKAIMFPSYKSAKIFLDDLNPNMNFRIVKIDYTEREI